MFDAESEDFKTGYLAGLGAGKNIGLAIGTIGGAQSTARTASALIFASKASANDGNVILDAALALMDKTAEDTDEITSGRLIEYSDYGSEGVVALFPWLCPMSNGDEECTPSCLSGSGDSRCSYFDGLQNLGGMKFILCGYEGDEE